MIIRQNDKPLRAISYDTRTFGNLKILLNYDEPGIEIDRVTPAEFFKDPDSNFQYINLVTLDFEEREKISKCLDQHSLSRFSFIDDSFDNPTNSLEYGPGCLILKGVFSYKAKVGKDCIIHGRVSLAENVVVGDGCFFSGLVTIAGSSTIGNFCFISTNVTIMDNTKITDHVRLLPGMVVRKSISETGTYYNPYVFEVKKMKDTI
jgi:acetyltransferase-like isoleucine patch superfamily enzyme